MFKRRIPLNVLQKMREVIWPSIGWIRLFRYVRYRIARLPGSASSIAAGLAIGAAMSFTPFIGTHFIQSALVAYAVRVNVGAALLGTFVGNPWTFPFMWWAAMSFGAFLLGLFGIDAESSLPDHVDIATLWKTMLNEPFRIFMPWFVGGYLMALLSWPIFYGIFYQIIKTARFARSKARMHTLHKAAKEVTGQDK